MTELSDAPRELLALACASREDWNRDETWSAILAAKHAGWPFARIVREITRLLLIDDSGPRELRFAAGETRTTAPGTLPEDLRAQALAACEDASEAIRQQRRDGSAA